jgi:biopolymer transport protein ExbB
MGTIYGLILAFAAVASPDVSPVEKSSLLAVGISAAMNTTLLGLMIAVPCVLTYSILRSRVDGIVAEIDRYAVAMIKVLTPADMVLKSYKVSDRRIKEEVETEPNMVLL